MCSLVVGPILRNVYVLHSLHLFLFLSMVGFNVSLAQIDVSTAYAVWSALGTMVVTSLGILVFKEKCTLVKIACLFLIVSGVVGLQLLT